MELLKQKLFKDGKEISKYVSNRFFRCVKPFLSWMKVGEAYWFEHLENGDFEVRSDNQLGKRFSMSEEQLVTCFFPTDLENNFALAIVYGYWLADHGIYQGSLDGLLSYYNSKKSKNISWKEHISNKDEK